MSVLSRDENREHTSTVRSIVPKIPNIVQVIEALNKGVRKFPGDTNETAHIHVEKVYTFTEYKTFNWQPANPSMFLNCRLVHQN